jgi:anaerobic dimethyl sulfoxide reductase subunit C (anchor subunit)
MFRETWSLMAFTVLAQFAVGLCIFMGLDFWLLPEGASEQTVMQLTRTGLMAAAFLLALAMMFSFFHLGRPTRAYRTIANLKSSWLSREILFSLGLFLLVLASCTLYQNSVIFLYLMAGTIAFGIINVVAMASVYSTTGKDGWAGMKPYLLFFISTIVLGAAGSTVAALYVGAIHIHNGNILHIAIFPAFGLVTFLLGQKLSRKATKQMITGSVLSLLGMILVYANVIYWLPGKSILALVLPILMLVAGECITRYGFYTMGLAEQN